MLKLINRVLALAIAAVVAGAVFVTVMAIWSWWAPVGPISTDVTSPPEADAEPLERLDSVPLPR
ncbi:MAG: hypothetical protein QGI10_07770 [Vicinamibacterales bacterium]|jgi:hypothetical protein|nr:hypothetical protein [Vicinamibacterales bacterium]HJN43164.1 hypothetical protein [Vicinamibacterales bacterium]|tara:strand:+ start:2877 stop:3068 length:192 start_codon:yes stop_codon:yes gene_type:complete